MILDFIRHDIFCHAEKIAQSKIAAIKGPFNFFRIGNTVIYRLPVRFDYGSDVFGISHSPFYFYAFNARISQFFEFVDKA